MLPPPAGSGEWRLRKSISPVSKRKVVAEKYPARYFLDIQDKLNRNISQNVFGIRGPSNPANGLTKRKPDLALPSEISTQGEFRSDEHRSPQQAFSGITPPKKFLFQMSCSSLPLSSSPRCFVSVAGSAVSHYHSRPHKKESSPIRS